MSSQVGGPLQILWEEERKALGLEKKQSFIDLGCGNGLLVYLLSSEGVGIYALCNNNIFIHVHVCSCITSCGSCVNCCNEMLSLCVLMEQGSGKQIETAYYKLYINTRQNLLPFVLYTCSFSNKS